MLYCDGLTGNIMFTLYIYPFYRNVSAIIIHISTEENEKVSCEIQYLFEWTILLLLLKDSHTKILTELKRKQQTKL